MKNKTIGIVLLVLALWFLLPIPGPDDVVGLKLYSMYSGVNVGLDNLSSIYLDYMIFSTVVGLILLLIAMHFLNWSWKRLWHKINLGKYNLAIGLAVLAVLAVALFDIWSMNSGLFGSVVDYTNGNYMAGWWDLFFKFVIVLFLAVPTCYFFFVHRDFSESFGIFGASIIMFFGGLADLAYFIFQRTPIPKTLPWLNHFFIGWVSNTLGFEQVTDISLLISVIISFLITYFFIKIMKEKF